MNKLAEKLPLYLLYAIGIAFSIKSLREPDIWWQIRTGDWILQNGKVPNKDIFSFTYAGQNWINIKWLFEVLAATINKYIGAESIFILQIIVTVLIVYYLKKIAVLYKLYNPTTFLLAGIIFFVGVEFRMIGRPEMFSHLFTVIYLYLLSSYLKTNSKWIWCLIPLQIIWSNLHESYGLGIVIIGIFIVIQWFESIKCKLSKPYLLSVIGLLSILSISCNPRGLTLLVRPFNIFSQVQTNKYTTELSSIFSSDYWQMQTYLLLIIILTILIFYFRKIDSKLFHLTFSLHYVIAVVAFILLSATAYRNIIFGYIILFPIILFCLNGFSYTVKMKNGFIILGLISYVCIISNQYYKWIRPKDRYGMEVLSTMNPVDAGEYLALNNLSNKKGFSDYLSSSYLLWKLQPSFKTYIDLRDLDVFPNHFFDEYFTLINDPRLFHNLDMNEHFQYVALYRNAYPALHAYLYSDSIFACTYVDPVVAIYEKTDSISHQDFFSKPKPVQTHPLPMFINKLFNPFYSSFNYDDLNIDFIAATYYYMVGKISFAEKRIHQYLSDFPEDKNALDLQSKIEQLKQRIK